MKAEEGALTTLTTLDVFSSVIILSLVYSLLPVGLNPAFSLIFFLVF